MLKNWRTIAKIVVAVLTALLGTVGAALSDSVAPLYLYMTDTLTMWHTLQGWHGFGIMCGRIS
jgi:hypothetical protein